MSKLSWMFAFALVVSPLAYTVAQTDGLDQNSFDSANPQSGQTEGESPNSGSDSTPEISNETPSGTPNSYTESAEVPNDNGPAPDLNSPAFDEGAIIDEQNPESLSNQIRNLNPDSLTNEQDYFPSFIYDERGRKDPFQPRLKAADKMMPSTQDPESVVTPEERIRAGLAKFEISALTLTAILIGKQNRPKALLKDPTGTVYVIHENDIIGRNNGVVKKIRQGQVVIVEHRDQKEGDRLYTTQILSLGK